MTKAEIRKTYLERRRSLTSEGRSDLSKEIIDRLFSSVNLAARRVVNCYLSVSDLGEVETGRIFQTLWDSQPDVVTTAPRIDPVTGELNAVIYDRDTRLFEGPWRIPEPEGPPIAVTPARMGSSAPRSSRGRSVPDKNTPRRRQRIPGVVSMFTMSEYRVDGAHTPGSGCPGARRRR